MPQGRQRQQTILAEEIDTNNKNQKKDGLAILIPVKTDIKIKTIARDKEGHYIMIEELIQKEDITFANAYAPNRGAY